MDEVHKDKTEEIHHWKMILKRDTSSDDQVSRPPVSIAACLCGIPSVIETDASYQRF